MGGFHELGAVLFVWLGLGAPVTHAAATTLSCEKFLAEVRARNDRYEKHDANAGAALLKLLPPASKDESGIPNDTTRWQEAMSECKSYKETMEALRQNSVFRISQLQAGNPTAFRIMFRLLVLAVYHDELLDQLDRRLGETITKYPKKFLTYLREEFGDEACSDLLVGSIGSMDENNDKVAYRKECQNRIRALLTVKDPSLRRLRAVCIQTLKTIQHARR